MSRDFDALIIGAGPAGLNAAMSLGRMSRRALVVDDQRPRNARAMHMHNFASNDGLSPSAWREKAKADLQQYKTIEFAEASVIRITKVGKGFEAELSDSKRFAFRKMILAHGIEDRLSSVSGLETLWGRSIFHCPYCHGFEVKGRRLGLVANGPIAEHMLPMIYSLSQDLILFTEGPMNFNEEFKRTVKSRNIRIIEDKIKSLEHAKDNLKAVALENGEQLERDALFWTPILTFKMKSDLGIALGCEMNEMGLYTINEFSKTTIDGVFAAGDIVKPMHSVLAAAASGQLAGAAAVGELLSEDFFRT